MSEHDKDGYDDGVDDDFTMGDVFRAHNKARQQKRAQNREASASVLKNRGISFEEKNFGAHLIVRHNSHAVDFWPGTGKFIFRGSGIKGHGVFNLIKELTK